MRKNQKEKQTLKIKLLGQSGIKIKHNRSKIIYIDPYLSNSVERYENGEIKRKIKIKNKPESVKKVNWILITHEHIDHCDPDTIIPISKNNPNTKYYSTLPVRKKLYKWGISKTNIVKAKECYTKIDKNIKIKSVPAEHYNLVIDNDNEPIAIGIIIKYYNKLIYIAGDTSISNYLIKCLKECEKINTAFLPVNEDNFFRRRKGIIGNMSIREAYGLADELGIEEVIPTHWDMFEINSCIKKEIVEVYKGYNWKFKLNMNRKIKYKK